MSLLEDNLNITKEKQDPENNEKEETVIEIKDITEISKHSSVKSIITQDIESLEKDVSTKDYIELKISAVNEIINKVEKARNKHDKQKSDVFIPRKKKVPAIWVQYTTGQGPGQGPGPQGPWPQGQGPWPQGQGQGQWPQGPGQGQWPQGPGQGQWAQGQGQGPWSQGPGPQGPWPQGQPPITQPSRPEGSIGGGADHGGGGFDYDPNTRNSFVKLVFVILTIMLLVTAGLVMAVFFVPVLTEFYMDCGKIYLLISLGLMLGLNFAMACCGCTRMPPFNYLCLVLTVILMSNIVAFISVRYKVRILCLAFIATAITMFVCTLLACSSFDFTRWYLYLVVISIAFCVLSLIISLAMFVMKIRFKPLQIALLFIGALINVVTIVMELQMILGGRSIELGESDYALGAYLLYTSIISLFLDLLQMIGLIDN